MKKAISLIIGLIIFVQLLIPIVSYAAIPTYSTYLALGDSIAEGYGLSNPNTQRYSEVVRSKLGVSKNNTNNMAVSGMTCEEFYSYIQQNDKKEWIQKSDIITVSIGSNELLTLATGALSEATGIPANDPAFMEKVQQVFIQANILKKFELAQAVYNFFTSQETKNKINASIAKYQEFWDKSVKYIKSINANADIIATEFYNPYYEVNVLTYDLGGFVAEPIEKMNTVLKTRSNNETDYKIAKIYDGFNKTNPRLTNVSIDIANSKINMDPHPSSSGHQYIASKIMDAVATIEKPKTDISKLTISSIKDQTYTGQEIRPQVTIKDGSKTLSENKDYTLIFMNNVKPGEAKVKITGIGDYTGDVIKTFNIKEANTKKDINQLNISNIPDQTYMGIKLNPDVEIKDGSNTLVNDKDYSLTYKNNVNVGKASITIKGIGNYTGTKTVNFNITAKTISGIKINDIPDQKYTGNEIKPVISAYDESIRLVEGKDYSATYSNNVNAGTATITLTGTKNYTGTITKNFNIIADDPVVEKNIADATFNDLHDYIYTGKLITPEVTLYYGETLLTKNVDYKLSYHNNINVGTAIMTITGLGEYKGTAEHEFNILKKDINHTLIEDIENQKYTGKEIKPVVKIISENIELVEGQDYTIEYSNNTNVGTATITIKGINNYEGTMYKSFIIEKEGEEDGGEDAKPQDDDGKPDGQNTSQNQTVDPTVSNKDIPDTGEGKTVLIAIGVITGIGIIAKIGLIIYKKYI